ncbi:hypothetical protein RhiirB3_434437 [Rhizophagus irregularis]|nr:hypothetical protein RhiirB3_434437 [Rhizophagus irregularis]
MSDLHAIILGLRLLHKDRRRTGVFNARETETVLTTNNMIDCSGEAAAAPNFALKMSSSNGPEIADINIWDADQDSQGFTEEEILYYTKQQQTFSLFIGVKLFDKITASVTSHYQFSQKNEGLFDIRPSFRPGIFQVSKILLDFQKGASNKKSCDDNGKTNQNKQAKKKKNIIGYHLIINVDHKRYMKKL